MGIRGLTLDTGALIALERRNQRMAAVFATATKHRSVITVPTAAVAEWWRGRSVKRGDLLLSAVVVEPLTLELAKLAGEAQAALPHSTPIDAIVMASAASRGDMVYTSDPDDLSDLQSFFPDVRVMRT